MTQPHLGLIVPPAAGAVPVDGPLLYGERIRFSARGLGLGEISTRGYLDVIDSVVEKAVALKDEGVSAVSLMGTSLSFFRGAAFNRQLEVEMARATGLPCTTMSNAIVGALRGEEEFPDFRQGLAVQELLGAAEEAAARGAILALAG